MRSHGEILDFWFADGPNVKRPIWFQSTPAFDAACLALCGAMLATARDGAYDAWADTAEGALALLLVLDQMPRNIHRGTAAAFASDAKARQMAQLVVERGQDQQVHPVQRSFLYLPFEHSEDLADQETSMRLFTALAAAPGYPNGDVTLDYAGRHLDVIRRFGRFPHRNAALGRISTVAEADYLARAGAGF